MKVDSEHTKEFVAALDAALSAGWSRAHDAEKRASEINAGGEFFYYYCDKRENRQAAMVSIYRKDAETLHVTNVVPTELSELNHQQYNGILQDLHDTVLRKLHKTFPAAIMLASNQLRIENLMSADAFRLLRQFSAMANKSTGSSHPMDCERWFAFLVTLRRSNHGLDTHSLLRWLVEVEQWPDEAAQDLASQFEFAMGSLDHAAKA